MDLRGASADALEQLSTELTDVVAGGADAGTLGDQLFTVAVLLRNEPSLRRIATDVTQPAGAKQGLMASVLDGKIDDAALGLVKSSVAFRWTLSRDLPDALERLSEIAVVKSAGKDGDALVDELFEVGQLVNRTGELRDALSDPARSVADKAELVDTVLGGKVLPATVTLTKQALAGSYRTVTGALAAYRKVAAGVAEETVATLRVVHPLSDGDKQRIAEILSRQYGRTVHVNEVIDPEVLGGVHIEIGDDVIDGTIASRVADARRRLVG